MSKRMRESLPYLQVLAKSKPKLRKMIIEHGPPDLIMCIAECSLNLLKGVNPLKPHQKKRLTRYKKHLRVLSDKKLSLKKRRSVLSQQGGGLLTALIPTVLSVLGSLLTK